MTAKVIGVYNTEQEVIETINRYKSKGIDPNKFSILAKDEQRTEYITEETDIQERPHVNEEAAGLIGGFLAGIGGGIAVPGLTVPGVGPLMAAGPLAAMLSGSGKEDLHGTFEAMGVDEKAAAHYVKELENGMIILFVEG
ncbi:MAG TPA: general stress protein [Bacillaceae bacterium]